MVVSRFFKNWPPSYLTMILIKMGHSNEDIWILEFALNNGNLFGKW
jgi:hypothetical protein